MKNIVQFKLLLFSTISGDYSIILTMNVLIVASHLILSMFTIIQIQKNMSQS